MGSIRVSLIGMCTQVAYSGLVHKLGIVNEDFVFSLKVNEVPNFYTMSTSMLILLVMHCYLIVSSFN
jgi:hypothetical protein